MHTIQYVWGADFKSSVLPQPSNYHWLDLPIPVLQDQTWIGYSYLEPTKTIRVKSLADQSSINIQKDRSKTIKLKDSNTASIYLVRAHHQQQGYRQKTKTNWTCGWGERKRAMETWHKRLENREWGSNWRQTSPWALHWSLRALNERWGSETVSDVLDTFSVETSRSHNLGAVTDHQLTLFWRVSFWYWCSCFKQLFAGFCFTLHWTKLELTRNLLIVQKQNKKCKHP